jgi:hypothetical protein
VTPEQIARLSLDIGREVTELVQRRLTEAERWAGAPMHSKPVHEDEAPVGTFQVGHGLGRFEQMMYATDPDPDGGVAADAKRVVRGQPPLQRKPEDEDGA